MNDWSLGMTFFLVAKGHDLMMILMCSRAQSKAALVMLCFCKNLSSFNQQHSLADSFTAAASLGRRSSENLAYRPFWFVTGQNK